MSDGIRMIELERLADLLVTAIERLGEATTEQLAAELKVSKGIFDQVLLHVRTTRRRIRLKSPGTWEHVPSYAPPKPPPKPVPEVPASADQTGEVSPILAPTPLPNPAPNAQPRRKPSPEANSREGRVLAWLIEHEGGHMSRQVAAALDEPLDTVTACLSGLKAKGLILSTYDPNNRKGGYLWYVQREGVAGQAAVAVVAPASAPASAPAGSGRGKGRARPEREVPRPEREVPRPDGPSRLTDNAVGALAEAVMGAAREAEAVVGAPRVDRAAPVVPTSMRGAWDGSTWVDENRPPFSDQVVRLMDEIGVPKMPRLEDRVLFALGALWGAKRTPGA